MVDSDASFISELTRAANGMRKLTKAEQSELLRRAADTLRGYIRELNGSGTPANNGELEDVARKWSEMAGVIAIVMTAQISKQLLHAVDILKATRMLLEIKRNIAQDASD